MSTPNKLTENRKSALWAFIEALCGYYNLTDDSEGVPNSPAALFYLRGALEGRTPYTGYVNLFVPQHKESNDAMAAFRDLLRQHADDIDALLTPADKPEKK